MSALAPNGSASLGVCIAIRDMRSATTDSRMFGSVLSAVEYGIRTLRDRTDRTAVVVVGEEEGRVQLDLALPGIASALAEKLEQPGLFVSLAAQDIVRDRLRFEARFEDFGVHEAGGLQRAERLFAVVHPDLVEPEPPLKRVHGNCPRLHKSFVGRHRETDELQELTMYRRIVTVVGPPGVGKTTMAIHVARSCAEEYPHGIWWFSVDGRESFDDLLQSMSAQRELVSLKGAVTVERMAEALSGRECMILLDGCETMREDVGRLVSALVDRAGKVSCLLTSTQAMGIEGEYVFQLGPMTLPASRQTGEESLIASDALALFFERATQVGRPFALSEENIALATELCTNLDGLPGSIELAAAAVRTSSLPALVRELRESLSGSQPSKSLRKINDPFEVVLRLSYAQLSPGARHLLRCLSLFRGEWTLDVATGLWSGVMPSHKIEELHERLSESSWIAHDPDTGCYRMLQPIRAFCWEQAGSDQRQLLATFTQGMGKIAERTCTALMTSSDCETRAALARHYADFAFAFQAALKRLDDGVAASALLQNLVHFWHMRHLLDDAERLCGLVLSRSKDEMDIARALVMIGVVNLRRRRLDKAREAFERCLPMFRRMNMPAAEASVLVNLAVVLFEFRELERSAELMSNALNLMRGLRHPGLVCQTLCNAAGIEIRRAHYDSVNKAEYLGKAEAFLREAEPLIEPLDAVKQQSYYSGAGTLALAKGRVEDAEHLLLKAIAVCSQNDLRHEAGEATEALAEIHLVKGLPATAAKLLGLTKQLRKESGKSGSEFETQRLGALVGRLHEHIDPDRADRLMHYGEKLEIAEILTPIIFNV